MTNAEGERHPIDRLILDAARSDRGLTDDEVEQVRRHVAQAGFDSAAREHVRGRLAGFVWRGGPLRGSDTLSPAELKYVWHVLVREEWPAGISLDDYLASIRRIILDPTSGLFTNRYQGAWSLAVIRASRELRGPGGYPWVLVQYRVEWGHWTSTFQPEEGLGELQNPDWSEVRWIRRPVHTSESH